MEIAHLLASSSRSLASNSLLGGYFGKVDGSQGRGFVVKNWTKKLLTENLTSRIKMMEL